MLIKRSIFNCLQDNLVQYEINILLGARQVGKSTLMMELQKSAQLLGLKTLSFNLELPNDLLWFSKSDSEIFKILTSQPNTIIFIDEFQYLKNASKLFKAIHDLKKNIKIIASGSSSIEIHKHLKESLAGRRKIFKIDPFNLNEWKETGLSFDTFCIYGGLPGIIQQQSIDNKIEYLSQMVQTYIMKDIKGLIKEENIRAFNHLLFYLAENLGNILPISHLASEIGVSQKTVDNYIQILEQTFIVYNVQSYSNKLANELKKSNKFYFYDVGIRNSLVKDFSNFNLRNDSGCLLENLVLTEFKNIQKSNVEIRFWRTKDGKEVDFIWIKNRKPIPIEVKSTIENDRIPAGLIQFMKKYQDCKVGYVVNLSTTKTLEENGYTIKYITPDEIRNEFN